MLSSAFRTFQLGTPVVLACLVVLASGCGKSRRPVFAVNGRVLDADKKPVVGATVIFHPTVEDKSETLRPVGKTDDTGAFKLTTYSEGDGAPEGDYTVTVTHFPRKKSMGDKEPTDTFKGKYADAKKSAIKFKVENKPQNDVPTIELKP